MGPALCTRWKGAGYVDLRHVLFGDHTARESGAVLGSFLVAICCLLRRTSECTDRSSAILTSLVCHPVEARRMTIG